MLQQCVAAVFCNVLHCEVAILQGPLKYQRVFPAYFICRHVVCTICSGATAQSFLLILWCKSGNRFCFKFVAAVCICTYVYANIYICTYEYIYIHTPGQCINKYSRRHVCGRDRDSVLFDVFVPFNTVAGRRGLPRHGAKPHGRSERIIYYKSWAMRAAGAKALLVLLSSLQTGRMRLRHHSPLPRTPCQQSTDFHCCCRF